MIARLRVVVDVSYDFDVGEPDENGNVPRALDAALHAENDLMAQVKAAVAPSGTVLEELCLVEEVRQA